MQEAVSVPEYAAESIGEHWYLFIVVYCDFFFFFNSYFDFVYYVY